MVRKALLLIVFISIYGGVYAQFSSVTISGQVKNSKDTIVSFVNIQLFKWQDSSYVAGTISDENGRFSLPNIFPAEYYILFSLPGHDTLKQTIFVGTLSEFIDLGIIKINPRVTEFSSFKVSGKKNIEFEQPEKKTFTPDKNISQTGGSVLQIMQNLPGVTIQDGKIMIRGSDKVIILIDGKQTALTGMGGQANLDNIPASSVERIEIINNPSSRYDANGNAGIINIILKKGKKEGFHGKAGLSTGLGALWIKKENLPNIRQQYSMTPKLNPTFGFNYRTKKINVFFQGDLFYNPTLNKNEFITRTYDSGLVIKQQTKRNRNTSVGTVRAGFDYDINKSNLFSFSTLFSSEKILDNGDQPFFNENLTDRRRLWQFVENEIKTTATTLASFNHKYSQPGRHLNISLAYTFHRENERYDFTNILPTYTGYDAFHFISNEHVFEAALDYIKPLKFGRVEMGGKYRKRYIPTNMQFFPGLNSPLDSSAGGQAQYNEDIPAIYSNYAFENKKLELEAGLRLEYVKVQYIIPQGHPTYSSNGYNYIKPFPNLRFAYKFDKRNKFSLSFNQRVDRPEEFDIRIFPKYDDAEIIKVGNPALKPQFTSTIEIAYKHIREASSLYTSIYYRISEGTITRIASVVPPNTTIYSVMQNAGKSYQTGLEILYSFKIKKWFTCNSSATVYNNTINSFSIENKYPISHQYTSQTEKLYSGNFKINTLFDLKKTLSIQVTGIYLAPDLIPQGRIGQRFSLDAGLKRVIQGGKGEIFANATDLLNTMVIRKDIQGVGFNYSSRDYYETQVIRLGYNYKF